MSEFKQKGWTATDEAEEQLDAISKDIGNANASATIRYCISQVYKQLKKQRSLSHG